ncbi:hypothetical protein L1887_59796 [Cichorium endivia]|nr:hypothetical protein L1887_59796 [Cichorium endivia]
MSRASITPEARTYAPRKTLSCVETELTTRGDVRHWILRTKSPTLRPCIQIEEMRNRLEPGVGPSSCVLAGRASEECHPILQAPLIAVYRRQQKLMVADGGLPWLLSSFGPLTASPVAFGKERARTRGQ